MDVLGHPELDTGVPARAIQDEHDLLGGTRPDVLGKGGQLDLKEGDADGGSEVEDRPARGGMDKADQIAPVIAVLHWRERALPVEAPNFVQDRLEPDAVLVDGPTPQQLNGGLREGGRDGLDERPYLFLNSACWSGSAKTWRGRGLRRLPSRRTRYAQPSWALIGRPSFALIQTATMRPSQASPSGAGPRTASASSLSCSSESSGAARCEWVYCRLVIPAGPSTL